MQSHTQESFFDRGETVKEATMKEVPLGGASAKEEVPLRTSRRSIRSDGLSDPWVAPGDTVVTKFEDGYYNTKRTSFRLE